MTRYLADLGQDLRFAARILRRAPVFAAVAVLTLALGVGLNTTVFSLLSAVVLRPLPVPDAGRVMSLAQTISASGGASIPRNVRNDDSYASVAEYRHYQVGQHVFSGLAAFASVMPTTLAEGSGETPLTGSVVSCNFFQVLQVPISGGRGLLPADCQPGAAPVVVVDYAHRALAGKLITLNRTAFEVVGAAPPDFAGADVAKSQFYVPISDQPALDPSWDMTKDANLSWLEMIGRLRPGTSRTRAAAKMQVLATQLDASHPHRITRVAVSPATLASATSMHTAVSLIGLVLLVATGLILILACANLASLLLARAARRRPEMATRLALGASRGRLVRQLLAESLVLGTLGAGVGGIVGTASARPLLTFLLGGFGTADLISLRVPLDWRVLLFVAATAGLAVCCSGLAPALRASRPNQISEIRSRLRSTLVGVQVAACMVLLLATGLTLRALGRTEAARPDFNADHIESVAFDLARAGYGAAQAATTQRQLAERLRALPGVVAVAQTGVVPLGFGRDLTGINANGHHLGRVLFNRVSPEYFAMLRLRLLQGRVFSPQEIAAKAAVMVVNQALARRLWPGESALGKTVRRDKREVQVVGVVADAQLTELGVSDEPYVFWPAGPDVAGSESLLVETRAASATLAPSLRAAVAATDPRLPVTLTSLASGIEQSQIAPVRLVSGIASSLGGLALTLALLGVFGMVAYRVQARLHEMGIRMALGAERGALLGLAVRQALLPVALGLTAGLGLGAGVATLLASGFLAGVSPFDPLTFVGAPLLLLAAAVAATLLAAHRALGRDPVAALRRQ